MGRDEHHPLPRSPPAPALGDQDGIGPEEADAEAAAGARAGGGNEELGLAVGTRVRHPRWGEGTVQPGEEGQVLVAFDEHGYKTMAVEVLRRRGDALLEAVG